uniref:Uncharacterized protein n=1 Tax=Romanomermis culicivorax TaxID=13658 RepID=A0A915LCW9_ROMCU
MTSEPLIGAAQALVAELAVSGMVESWKLVETSSDVKSHVADFSHCVNSQNRFPVKMDDITTINNNSDRKTLSLNCQLIV